MTTIAPSIYQAVVLKSALKLYHRTGIKANRAYTPSAMLRTAGNITGKKFKRGEYLRAMQALEVWIEENR